ncbi:MAG: hypothetical protein ACOCQE_02715 [Halanaerobium sp.]
MVYIKLCPECTSRSIGSSKQDWTCPHCGEDLSDEPVFRQIRIDKDIWGSLEAKRNERNVLA